MSVPSSLYQLSSQYTVLGILLCDLWNDCSGKCSCLNGDNSPFFNDIHVLNIIGVLEYALRQISYVQIKLLYRMIVVAVQLV